MLKIAYFLLSVLLLMGLTSCTTYRHMKKVKLVSFVEKPIGGESIGRVEGEDCTWNVLGRFNLGEASFTEAFEKARINSGDFGSVRSAVSGKEKGKVKYMTNVRSEHKNSNYIVVTNSCYVVSGTGYK